MMNTGEYIQSGILQDYCLGLLSAEEKKAVEENCRQYPAIKTELEAFQASLQKYVAEYTVTPKPSLKETIWKTLENINLEEKANAEQPPVLNKYADYQNWLKIVKPLLPAKLENDIFLKTIRDDEEVFQTVIWARIDYPDEVHDDLQECFLVLEGECECHIGDKVIRVGEGGYFEIPLHEHHDVKILTPHVLAVVQRKKVA